MSRGFGTTLGVASTDRIVTDITSLPSLVSASFWAWKGTGSGGPENGRLFEKDADIGIYWGHTTNKMFFWQVWSPTEGNWSCTGPTSGAWHHFLIVYNRGSTGQPVIYIDGSSVTVTTDQPPSGTVTMNSSPVYFGNAWMSGSYNRNWDGYLAEFAFWNTALSLANAQDLAGGGSPLHISNSNLLTYFMINGSDSPELDSKASYTGTVTGTVNGSTDPVIESVTTPLVATLSESLLYG